MNTITNRMSGDEAALWTKLSTFAFDGADTRQTRPSLTFAARLARENGWNIAYTQRVIEEYRKFLFLCCVTPSGVTPSDPVDQAWHLHLTYTRSYWIDLCRHTIGREIHHNPTRGGASEEQKFDGMYTHSHDLYQHYFGTKPPASIWHDNQQRFSDIDFERINRRTNWVIPKPGWVSKKTVSVGLCLLIVAGLFVQAAGSVLLVLLLGGSLTALLVYSLSTEFTAYRKRPDADGSDGAFIGSTDSDDGHNHGHDGHHGDSGHGDSGHGGDSGCSSSGCSSGCGGGCGGGD